jgi:putative pyruvate formate lyase activating enzyme
MQPFTVHVARGGSLLMGKGTDQFIISRQEFEPAYLSLYRTGELADRVQRAIKGLEACRVCPRNCESNRLADERGVCKTGRLAVVSSAFPHFGEEDVLRGRGGSGTIFFSNCNLRCVFCQNADISQDGQGAEISPSNLAQMMLRLQALGCHNINFVTPEHVVPQVLEALLLAVESGLRLPIVYNTSAYDSLHSLRLLDGVVDIYMPDFKIWDRDTSLRYLRAKDYPDAARRAIAEMHRQVGPLKMDGTGIALRGVLLRHLVMPESVAGTPAIMRFLAQDISPNTYVNLMSQYRPAAKVNRERYPEINRRITREEFARAFQAAREYGLWRFDRRQFL